jgi:hypothetical protein
MKRISIRLIGLIVMAVSAVVAVASASASAALCKTGGGVFTACSGGSVYEGELMNVNNDVKSALSGEVLETPTLLLGLLALAKLTAEPLGKSKGTIEFTHITVDKPAKCIVKEPIIANFTDQASKTPGPPTDLFTGSKEAETFTEIEFKDKSGTELCALKNKVFKVKGTQLAEFDSKIETEETNHTVIAKMSGSNLKLGENKAAFEAVFTEVETFPEVKPWALQED